jgi:hypothetical protein
MVGGVLECKSFSGTNWLLCTSEIFNLSESMRHVNGMMSCLCQQHLTCALKSPQSRVLLTFSVGQMNAWEKRDKLWKKFRKEIELREELKASRDSGTSATSLTEIHKTLRPCPSYAYCSIDAVLKTLHIATLDELAAAIGS